MLNWQIQHVHEIESTNAAALELLRSIGEKGSEAFSDEASNPAFNRQPTSKPAKAEATNQEEKAYDPFIGRVILADRQTAGHGQHGRTWFSPLGGLYMTAIIGDLESSLRPLAALLTGVAVAQAIEAEGISRVGLRWPNDVVIDGKKVAGILCEGIAIGTRWICIAGIGANINMPLTTFPPKLAARTTTLTACDGKTRNIRSLAESILHRLSAAMTCNPAELIEEVRRRDVLQGLQITVAHTDGTSTGLANGIDEQGALRLVTETRERIVAIGSVTAINGIAIR